MNGEDRELGKEDQNLVERRSRATQTRRIEEKHQPDFC